MEQYLRADRIIDWTHPEIAILAKQLSSGCDTAAEIAKACFEWVRDKVFHSVDYQMPPVTCRASDVLKYRTGYCFMLRNLPGTTLKSAKSYGLVASDEPVIR